MNRQQVVVSLAKITRISKEIHFLISTEDLRNVVGPIPELSRTKQYVEGISVYFRSNSCEPFIQTIDSIRDTKEIADYLRTHSIDVSSQMQLENFISSVELLKSYAHSFKELKKQEKYIHLTEELSNDKALSVVERAAKAGLLTANYQLNGLLNPKQVRVLAYAMSDVIGISKKRMYVTFERLWNISQPLARIKLPEKRLEAFKIVMNVFPEVDYIQLFSPIKNKYIDVVYDEDKVMTMFLSLITHGYIDRKTTFDNFRNLFKDMQKESRIPVNWTGTQRQLTYFAYLAFDNHVSNLWQKVSNCFLVKGKKPNMGSLKSGLSLTIKTENPQDYDSVLYAIAKTFTSELRFDDDDSKNLEKTDFFT